MPDAALSGTVPSQLGYLTTMLINFNVGSNSLEAKIPSQLGAFSKLYNTFSLASNGFTTTVPTQLGALTGASMVSQAGPKH